MFERTIICETQCLVHKILLYNDKAYFNSMYYPLKLYLACHSERNGTSFSTHFCFAIYCWWIVQSLLSRFKGCVDHSMWVAPPSTKSFRLLWFFVLWFCIITPWACTEHAVCQSHCWCCTLSKEHFRVTISCVLMHIKSFGIVKGSWNSILCRV